MPFIFHGFQLLLASCNVNPEGSANEIFSSGAMLLKPMNLSRDFLLREISHCDFFPKKFRFPKTPGEIWKEGGDSHYLLKNRQPSGEGEMLKFESVIHTESRGCQKGIHSFPDRWAKEKVCRVEVRHKLEVHYERNVTA